MPDRGRSLSGPGHQGDTERYGQSRTEFGRTHIMCGLNISTRGIPRKSKSSLDCSVETQEPTMVLGGPYPGDT